MYLIFIIILLIISIYLYLKSSNNKKNENNNKETTTETLPSSECIVSSTIVRKYSLEDVMDNSEFSDNMILSYKDANNKSYASYNN